MKKTLSIIGACLMLGSSIGWAKGIFITPGARSNSMGGAFYAVADDLSSLYWNPSGIAHLKDRSGAEVSFFYTKSNATSNRALTHAGPFPLPVQQNGDFPLLKVYAAEPAAFENKELETTALVPFAAAYTNWKGYTFALGFYGIGGGGGKWSDSGGGTTASIDSTQGFTSVNLTAAKEVMSKLSVGLSVEMITSYINQKIQKDFSNPSGNPLMAAYYERLEKSNSGNGVQVSGSALYRFTERLQAGLVVRSGTQIKMTGKTTLAHNSSVLATALSVPMSFETNYEQKYIYPMTIGLGFAYKPRTDLTLAVGFDQNMYSQQKDEQTTYTTQLPGLLSNTGKSFDYKDTLQYRIGAEYRPLEAWSFRLGLLTDPVPYDVTAPNLLDTNQYNMLYVTTGASYWMKQVRIDLGLARGISDKPEKNGRTYEYPINIVRLGASYGF